MVAWGASPSLIHRSPGQGGVGGRSLSPPLLIIHPHYLLWLILHYLLLFTVTSYLAPAVERWWHLPRTVMGRRESPSRNQQPASPITWTILDLQREQGGGRLLVTHSLLVQRRRRAINHRGAALTPTPGSRGKSRISST